MAVVQEMKQKVRQVLDYRELKGFVDAFTANAEVCAQKLREWRRQGVNVSLLDLQNAYLQIHADKALWPFQTVIFRGQRFCLTRLGFGLNVAPLHQSGHPGAKRTIYFARLVDPQVSKETANSVVKACETCRSIDPAPVRWKKGKLGVKDNWNGLAFDITHHNGENFLTIIDCGLSRFAI